MSQTHYEVLEIDENSSYEEIKRAYRLLAVKYHPDKNKDPEAKVLFQKVSKAYEVLSDTEERASYNAHLKKSQESSTLKANRGTDLQFSIQVDILDLIKGNKRVVAIKRKGQCPTCEGTGSSNKKSKKCDFCSGTGLQGLPLILGQKKKCTYCSGIGHRPQDPCPKCRGTGLTQELIRHEITLNPFSYIIDVPNMGDYPVGGGKPGDLIIELDIKQSTPYKIRGLNVSGVVDISPAQAILGDTVTLNVFDKKTVIEIPPRTQHHAVIEQENGGLSFGGKTGIFKATIKIIMPDIITEEEKELYNKLLSLEKDGTKWPKVLSL